MPIRVALTDDHPMLLDGLQHALNVDPEIILTGAYRSAGALLHNISDNVPDVLLLDLQLPDRTGQEIVVELLRQYPKLRIIILSGIETPSVVKNMIQDGCKGYLFKSVADGNAIIKAIKTVFNGQLFLDPAIQERLLHDMLETKKKPAATGNRKLTAREKDVLQLIAMEYNNQQIAERLFISPRTVENHRHNLIQKLEVKNAVGLVKAAMELGLL